MQFSIIDPLDFGRRVFYWVVRLTICFAVTDLSSLKLFLFIGGSVIANVRVFWNSRFTHKLPLFVFNIDHIPTHILHLNLHSKS